MITDREILALVARADLLAVEARRWGLLLVIALAALWWAVMRR